MESTGGPIISLFYACFPIGVTVIVSVCYIGVWITIQVRKINLQDSQLLSVHRLSTVAISEHMKEMDRTSHSQLWIFETFLTHSISQAHALLFVWKCLQIQSRRMSHFAEGDKAKEERRKYQKTAQVRAKRRITKSVCNFLCSAKRSDSVAISLWR